MERTIKVTGRGNVKLKPDLTIIEMNLTNSDALYQNTLSKSTKDIAEIKDKLVKLGFSREDLKTTYFDINTEYESYRDEKGNYKSKFVGYRYNQNLKFTFGIDNKLLGKVLFALSTLNCSPKINIKYGIKDNEEAKNLLLKDAVTDANKKASIIAEALNVKLGQC